MAKSKASSENKYTQLLTVLIVNFILSSFFNSVINRLIFSAILLCAIAIILRTFSTHPILFKIYLGIATFAFGFPPFYSGSGRIEVNLVYLCDLLHLRSSINPVAIEDVTSLLHTRTVPIKAQELASESKKIEDAKGIDLLSCV